MFHEKLQQKKNSQIKDCNLKRLENLWHFCSQKNKNKSTYLIKFHGKVNKLIEIYCLCENTEQKWKIWKKEAKKKWNKLYAIMSLTFCAWIF